MAACRGITRGETSCRNYAETGQHFCHIHSATPPEEFKRRWISRYILGQGDNLFLFNRINSAPKARRLLADLEDGLLSLTAADIRPIPSIFRYIDVLCLLVSQGHIQADWNPYLRRNALFFALTCYAWTPPEKTNHYYQNYLLPMLKDQTNLLGEGSILMGLFKEDRILRLLETDKTAFLFFEALLRLPLAHYTYMSNVEEWLPPLLSQPRLLAVIDKSKFWEMVANRKQEFKAIQRHWQSKTKEDLMAAAWHPKRMEAALAQGVDPIDL